MPRQDPSSTQSAGRLPAEERRALILEAARRVFVRSGFAATRTRDIAAEAEISEGMLFRHFASKEQLFEDAVAAPLQEAVARTLRNSSPPPAPDSPRGNEIVRERSLELFEDLLTSMRELAPLLGVVLFADAEDGNRYYRERLEPTFAQLRQIILDYLPTWRHSNFDPDTIIRVVFGICWMIAVDDRFGSRPVRDSRELAAELVSIIYDGIDSTDRRSTGSETGD